jgi:hypothetical protein
MLGLLCLVGGVLIIKLLGNDLGWLLFLLGVTLACRGGISISQSGAKEIGN